MEKLFEKKWETLWGWVKRIKVTTKMDSEKNSEEEKGGGVVWSRQKKGGTLWKNVKWCQKDTMKEVLGEREWRGGQETALKVYE